LRFTTPLDPKRVSRLRDLSPIQPAFRRPCPFPSDAIEGYDDGDDGRESQY
jgi:hypothetical protein